jgi:hypothetical protein
MKTCRLRLSFGISVLLVGAISSGAEPVERAQGLSRTGVKCSTSSHACNLDESPKGFVRQIGKAESGACWLLLRNESHPERPGRLLLKRPGDDLATSISCGSGLGGESLSGKARSRELVIRTGDSLIIQEQTSQSYLQLEGVALGPAAAGDALDVRLSVFGRKVRAIAIGSGLAALLLQNEVQP